MKKIVIAAGGTGGHINPALAFADILLKKHPECEICFIGSSDRMEAEVIPSHGYRFIGYPMVSTYGGIQNKLRSVFSLIRTERQIRKWLKEEKADACVGFGNYISIPLIMAARSLGIPTMIHEQNSFAGKANEFLARFSDAVVGCYDSCLKQFPAERTRLYGNPESTLVSSYMGKDIKEEFHMDPEKPFVLFMMGSLGSSSVAKVIDESCRLFDPSFECLVVAGKANEYVFESTGMDHIHIVPYVDGAAALRQCALAVTRAGATTLAEITAIGTPAVLIPSPYVPNNHQVYNARELSDRQAAVLLEEKNLSVETLSAAVNGLMAEEYRRKLLGENAFRLGKRDAAEKMIEWLEALIAHE